MSEDVAVTSTAVEAMIDMARRLGLIWVLQPGTMDANNQVFLDGDEGLASVEALSLIGNQITGQRVMCLLIQPGGVYVVGGSFFVPPKGQMMAKLRRAALQTFATSGTADNIIFDTVDYDPYHGFSTASPTQWTAPFAGWYHCDCRINWATNATSRRGAFVDVNAGAQTVCGSSLQAAAAGTTQAGGSGTIELAVGDVLTLRGIQNSGGSLNTGTTDNGSQLDIIYHGPA